MWRDVQFGLFDNDNAALYSQSINSDSRPPQPTASLPHNKSSIDYYLLVSEKLFVTANISY